MFHDKLLPLSYCSGRDNVYAAILALDKVSTNEKRTFAFLTQGRPFWKVMKNTTRLSVI